ncbi:MAG: YtxH domain-containing protein [Elusimicrobia bacterium]|nr:YtxH domain-containing protein [Elusimicrobiota bacterium]
MEREEGAVSGISLFIGGVIVGAVTALLYAPRSGEETREQVGGWMQEKGERGRDIVGRLRERLPRRVQETAERVYPGREEDRRI